jgi:hypothetical protein
VNAKLTFGDNCENLVDASLPRVDCFERAPSNKPAVMNGKYDSIKQLFVFFIEGAVYEDTILVTRPFFRSMQTLLRNGLYSRSFCFARRFGGTAIFGDSTSHKSDPFDHFCAR